MTIAAARPPIKIAPLIVRSTVERSSPCHLMMPAALPAYDLTACEERPVVLYSADDDQGRRDTQGDRGPGTVAGKRGRSRRLVAGQPGGGREALEERAVRSLQVQGGAAARGAAAGHRPLRRGSGEAGPGQAARRAARGGHLRPLPGLDLRARAEGQLPVHRAQPGVRRPAGSGARPAGQVAARLAPDDRPRGAPRDRAGTLPRRPRRRAVRLRGRGHRHGLPAALQAARSSQGGAARTHCLPGSRRPQPTPRLTVPNGPTDAPTARLAYPGGPREDRSMGSRARLAALECGAAPAVRRRRGFTLVEMSVALWILLVALLCGMALVLQQPRVVRRIDAARQAVAVIEWTLEEMRAGLIPLQSTPDVGWTVSSFVVGSPAPDLKVAGAVTPAATPGLYRGMLTAPSRVPAPPRRRRRETMIGPPGGGPP